MGGFFESSRNVTLRGSVLFAQCIGEDKVLHDNELDLNAVLGNNNGSFVHPGSEALNSAVNFQLNFSTLQATLLNKNDIGIPASVNLDEYVYLHINDQMI